MTENYLRTRTIPLIIPSSEDLAVRLVKADLLSVMEDYRADENRWYATAWAFTGAILGIVVNWITAPQITVNPTTLVIMGAFAIIAVLSWIAARNYAKRADEIKESMLVNSTPRIQQ